MPVIDCTVGYGNCMVGTMTAGNSNGLLVPASSTEEEVEQLRRNLPQGVKLATVDDNLSALGNCIVANDFVALAHPEIAAETIKIIEETLNVPVYKMTIGGNPLVGTFCSLTNKAAVVQPLCSLEELKRIQTLIGVVCTSTVNRGEAAVGAGLVANDEIAFIGEESTSTELSMIDHILQLNTKK